MITCAWMGLCVVIGVQADHVHVGGPAITADSSLLVVSWSSGEATLCLSLDNNNNNVWSTNINTSHQ